MNDLRLFEPADPHRITRYEDPETSHAAARAIAPRAGTWRHKVYEALRAEPRGMTLQDLTDRWPTATESTVRTRCAELVDMGYVRDSGIRRRTRSGNQAIVWVVVS